jgi:hypothetical protein
MDFMSNALFDGRSFRILTLVDCHSRKSLVVALRTNVGPSRSSSFSIAQHANAESRRRSAATTTRNFPGGYSTNGPS